MDYALILKYLHSIKCNNSIIIEDDAIISKNWFQKLDSATKQINRKDLAYIKLFTGYKFFDWDWIVNPFVILKIILLANFIFLLQFLIVKNLFKRRFSFIYLFILFVNSITLVVYFNATSVNPMGAGLHEYTTGFGAVAVMIPNERLLNVSKFFEDHVNGFLENHIMQSEPKDLLLNTYRLANRQVELIMEPSLFQHIGIFSSLYLRDVTSEGYQRMFKSFSFMYDFKLIEFDINYSLS